MAQSPRLDLRPGVTEPVVLLISRREVEAGDIASVLSRLKPFLATREEAWRYRGQMTLVVDGYNDDPRELVDMPAVRSILRQLEAGWPSWAYFFNQVDDSIKLLLSCVAGERFLGRGAVEMDADMVAAALSRGRPGNQWVAGILEAMAALAQSRSRERMMKEAMYSSARLCTRLSAKDEVAFSVVADAGPAYLRRKRQQSKGNI